LGQTQDRQLDALADLGTALGERLAPNVGELWSMVNGYALAHGSGLDAIALLLEHGKPNEIDELRGRLRIGLYRDVEVTDADRPFALVSQARHFRSPIATSARETGRALPAWSWRPHMKRLSGPP
jgi:hypothetical protein